LVQERFGLFTMLIFGELIVAVLQQISGALSFELVFSIVCGFVISFCLMWSYFDNESGSKEVHAFRRNTFTGSILCVTHFPLACSILIAAYALNTIFLFNNSNSTERIQDYTRYMASVGIGATLFFCINNYLCTRESKG